MEPLRVVDMHTGGEPLRIVTSGYPPIPGATILEKRAYVRDHLDHLRKILMFEPRGHADMYGAILVEPSLPGADLAVLFMHNEGYSTMCGHAIIALGRFAVDRGMVEARGDRATVNIECPCGMVVAEVTIREGRAAEVSFVSVPSFLFAGDVAVSVPGHGTVSCDVAYGGAFYAIAPAARFGLEFGRDPVAAFIEAGDRLTRAAATAVPLDHPDASDLAFLYGSILTDGGEGREAPTRNICIFADRQVDRSPTGSGVTARMATFHAKASVAPGEIRMFESIVGSRFSGSIEETTRRERFDTVTVRVGGSAHYAGEAVFSVEPDDPLGGGFIVR
jgi:proline racemase